MFSTRNVIAAVIVIAVLSVAYTVYDLAKPPNGGGVGVTSYGVRAHGYRAIFEVIQELGFNAERSHFPPPSGLDSEDTLMLIAPNQSLVRHEPEHLRRTGDWIGSGGQAVVALESDADYSISEDMAEHENLDSLDVNDMYGNALLIDLGLPDLIIEQIHPKTIKSADDLKLEKAKQDREILARMHLNRERSTGEIPVKLHGDLQSLAGDIATLRLPSDALQVLDLSTTNTAAEPLVTLQSEDGVGYTLVARVPRGRGRVTLISDSALLNNFTLEYADNSVLAANLLADKQRTAIFDEFYHGLSSRGNPLWLLTRPHYGWLFLMVVIAAAGWMWRQFVVLGPPLPPPEPTRRTISEYLEAMASLFTRSRQRKFVLGELRDGVNWSIRQELHLPPGQEMAETIVAALDRTQPRRAKRLRSINQQVTQVLAKSKSLNQQDFLKLTRELNRCL